MSTLLQIVLFVQAFAMGVLAAVAWRHAYAHFRPGAEHEHEHESHAPNVPVPIELSTEAKARLQKAAEAQFVAAVNNSAGQLQNDLVSTNGQINDLVMRLATDVVSSELEHYKTELSKLQTQAAADMSGVRVEVTKHEEELKAKMAQEIEAEKQKLLKQIDTKLADAVGSFLTETLQHNIDLGTQSAYLVQMLEEHKADFVKEVGSEDKSAG
jgi:hypothetical protein